MTPSSMKGDVALEGGGAIGVSAAGGAGGVAQALNRRSREMRNGNENRIDGSGKISTPV